MKEGVADTDSKAFVLLVSWVDREDIRQNRQEQELLWGGFVGGSGLGTPGL